MSELDTLQEVARETGLLDARGDEDALATAAYQFTVKAASRLRREGWRTLRGDSSRLTRYGTVIDSIVNRDSLQVVQIVHWREQDGGLALEPTWNPTRVLSDSSKVGEAPGEPEGRPPAPPAPAPLDPHVEVLRDVLIAFVHFLAKDPVMLRKLADVTIGAVGRRAQSRAAEDQS